MVLMCLVILEKAACSEAAPTPRVCQVGVAQVFDSHLTINAMEQGRAEWFIKCHDKAGKRLQEILAKALDGLRNI